MFLKIQIKCHNTKRDLWSLLRVLCIFIQNKAVLFKKDGILFTQMVRESSGTPEIAWEACVWHLLNNLKLSSAAGPEAQTGTSLSREAANVPT